MHDDVHMTPAWDQLLSSDDAVRRIGLVALWNSNKVAMYTLSFQMLRNHADAEDAVQEAMTGLLFSLRRVRPECSPRTYLMRVVRNACLDVIEKRSRVSRSMAADPEGASQVPGSDDPTARAEAEDTHASLDRALARLPETDRTVVTLRFVLGYDNVTAAEILSMRKNTFEVRLHRALRTLKALLAGGTVDLER